MNSPETPNDDDWEKVQEHIGNAAHTLAKLFSSQPAVPKPTVPKPTVQEPEAQKRVEKPIHPSIKRLEKGMTLLLDFLISPESMDPAVITEEFTEQLCQLAAIASIFSDHPEQYVALISTGKTLQEIFGLDDDSVEKLYHSAKYIYEQQHYEEASAAFSVLTIICPNNHTFWLALANCEYFLSHYEHALTAYAMAAHANPFDPLCHLFSAHCYEAMKQKDLAINALEIALVSIGEQEQYANWKQKITEYKKRLTLKT